jgi:hypothetical protein
VIRYRQGGHPGCQNCAARSGAKKIVFGTMKGLLSPEDAKALLDAIEAPLPDDVLASFHVGRLKAS